MDAFIYLPRNVGIGRDVIEDELEGALGEVGEVTGGGSGVSGSNLDLYLDDQAPLEKVLEIIIAALRRVGVAQAKIVIDGKEHPFVSEPPS